MMSPDVRETGRAEAAAGSVPAMVPGSVPIIVPEPKVSRLYAWYVVGVLLFCFTLSYVDRQILSLLIGPIKHDLHLTDTGVGLLQGLAFGIFFAMLGVPIGRLVDRLSRRNMVAAGVSVWSLMTALCGLAQSFTGLFLPRIGVGAGEATLTPAVFSMMSDYFEPEQLPFAMSVYSLGIFLGSGAAFTVGGLAVGKLLHMAPISLPLVGVLSAWRLSFLLLGLPGILGVLLLFTVKEPVRRKALRTASGAVVKLTIPQVLGEVRKRWRATLCLVIGLNCQSMCSYAFLGWAPAYMQRTFGWTARQAGLGLGTVLLIFGCTGMIAGGKLCEFLQRRGHRAAPLQIGAASALCMMLFFIPATRQTDPVAVLHWLRGFVFFLGMPIGSLFASIQMIYPSNVRGQVSAGFSLFNLISLILGPLVPALLNDYFFHNEARLGTSMAISVGGACLLMLVALLLGVRPYSRNYTELQTGLAA